MIQWMPAPAVACLGHDREPRCTPVVAYGVDEDLALWAMTCVGDAVRVERGDRLLLGGSGS